MIPALLLRIVAIYVRHRITGVWPGPRHPVWVYPLRSQRIGQARARFATANPYCSRRGAYWVQHRWYAALTAHYVWAKPAPVVHIGRPPREMRLAA